MRELLDKAIFQGEGKNETVRSLEDITKTQLKL